MVKKKELFILHDVDGRIYFEALQQLMNEKIVGTIKYRETSVVKRLLSAILKKKDVSLWFKRGIQNTLFRFQLPFLKNKTIIFGIAPYNIRFVFYGLLGIRNNVIYHTSWPYWWGDNVPYPYNGRNKFLRKIFKFYFNKFNFSIVGVTPPCVESIKSEISPEVKCKFIPHAVNVDLFKDETIKNIRPVNILYVGRLVCEKGIYELASAIKKLDPEYRFTIVGTGTEEANLKKMLGQLDNVNFMSHISDKSKLAAIFKEHDVLVLPSKKIDGWEELFGLVIIEAMACGLVVIASNHIGPRGIIDDGKNGFLISDGNLTSELVTKIEELSELDLTTIRIEARKTAIDYDIDSIKGKWDEVINETQY
ncbi:glycosyltransferase family 4 protein [Klebsiella pneumoniae]|nr:glycosyltransferase family 4 protein [Klebsiella pneumoniae]